MKSLREAIEAIEALTAKVASRDRLLVAYDRRLSALELARGYLENRDPCRVPPFPRELMDIGLRPPRSIA